MFETLLGGVFGGVLRLAPELFKLFDKKNERAHELRMLEAEMEFAKIKGEIESLIKKYNEQEETELKSLVKIYETMKPKDAARIFDELELKVLLQVFQRMKEAKTAPILASMSPARAKEVTTQLAERKELAPPN